MANETSVQERRSYKELDSKFQNLHLEIVKGFTEIKGHHESISKELLEIKKHQKSINDTVYGNGQEGLVTKVAKLKQKQNIAWTIIGAIGGSLLAGGSWILDLLGDHTT